MENALHTLCIRRLHPRTFSSENEALALFCAHCPRAGGASASECRCARSISGRGLGSWDPLTHPTGLGGHWLALILCPTPRGS